jgi:hypothetical protein
MSAALAKIARGSVDVPIRNFLLEIFGEKEQEINLYA